MGANHEKRNPAFIARSGGGRPNVGRTSSRTKFERRAAAYEFLACPECLCFNDDFQGIVKNGQICPLCGQGKFNIFPSMLFIDTLLSNLQPNCFDGPKILIPSGVRWRRVSAAVLVIEHLTILRYCFRRNAMARIKAPFTLYERTTNSGLKVWYYRTYDENGKRTPGKSTGLADEKAAYDYCLKLLKEDRLLQKSTGTLGEFAAGYFDADSLYVVNNKKKLRPNTCDIISNNLAIFRIFPRLENRVNKRRGIRKVFSIYQG